MKTALEQLEEEMLRFDWGHYDPVSIIKQFLPIEKQQIIQAHTEGQALIVKSIKESLKGIDVSKTETEIEKSRSGNDNDMQSELYFNQTFKTNI